MSWRKLHPTRKDFLKRKAMDSVRRFGSDGRARLRSVDKFRDKFDRAFWIWAQDYCDRKIAHILALRKNGAVGGRMRANNLRKNNPINSPENHDC